MDRKVFFVIHHIDVENEDMITVFSEFHGYSTVPWLSVSQESEKDNRYDGRFLQQAHEWNLVKTDNYSALKQIEFINNCLALDVQLKLNASQLLKANLVLVSILASFFMFIYFGYNLLINQYLWVLIAWAVWIVSVGGYVYVKIEAPELYEVDKNNRTVSYFDEAIR